MTVKELHTFTDAEIETITDALRIAVAHYRMLAETQSRGNKDFCHILEAQARDAGDLQLKIEAGR